MKAQVAYRGGDEGVLYAMGNENSGITVFVQGGRLILDYNAFNEHTLLESSHPLLEGENELSVAVTRTGRRTGSVELLVNGVASGSTELPFMMRMISSIGASVGMDRGSAVSTRYESPYPFTGSIEELTIQLGGGSADEEKAKAEAEISRQ